MSVFGLGSNKEMRRQIFSFESYDDNISLCSKMYFKQPHMNQYL